MPKIGEIYKSNNFGDFKIIDIIGNIEGKSNRYFLIEFINTGYRTISSGTAIARGAVKDKYVPLVAGVGFLGDFEDKVTDKDSIILYITWNDMINRCYNTADKDYYLYGNIGITVDTRWHCFNNFYYDAKLLPNYNKKVQYPNIYQLDKDYLQINIPKEKRIYSKDTCVWLSKHDNILIMNRDKETSSGYYGVCYKDGAWCTRINNTIYGRFTIPEAAANLFNYIYPLFRTEFNDIILLNDVKCIPYYELQKYTINKNICVGSTTIPQGVGCKYIRSNRASSFIVWDNEDEDIV